MKLLKWFAAATLTFLLIAAAIALFLWPRIQDALNSDRGPAGPAVQIEPAARGRIVRAVSAPGDIEPRRSVQISARTSAQIAELPFEAGQDVKAGDVVVRLDDKDLLAALDAAKARMRGDEARRQGASAAHLNSSLEWERVAKLFETNDVPKSELDTAEAQLRQAEANLAAAEHAIASAQADVARAEESLKYTTIRSPIDGRVTVLNAEVGEIVVTGTMNNAGTVILEIADLTEMLVRAQVDEIDIARVNQGQPAEIYVNAYPDDAFEGVVQRVALQSQVASGGTKFYDTEIAVYTGDRSLFAGLSATVDIEVEAAEGVILVPTQAVMDKRTDELPLETRSDPNIAKNKIFTPVVFVFDGAKARVRPVQTGFSDLTHTSILAGLEEGDEIIVGPWAQLRNLKDELAVRREGAEEDKTETDAAEDPDAETAQTETDPS